MKQSKKQSKEELTIKINRIFSNNPTKKEIKKTKKLAMSKNIKLTKFKRLYCNKCLTFFNSQNHEIRINKPLKIITCKSCGYKSRYKIS